MMFKTKLIDKSKTPIIARMIKTKNLKLFPKPFNKKNQQLPPKKQIPRINPPKKHLILGNFKKLLLFSFFVH